VDSGRDAAWYEVRFKEAALPARRASGAAWHVGEVDHASTILGGLIGLAVGYPDLGFTIGSALVQDAAPEAPAPFVVIKIDDETYSISPIGQTLAPRWHQPIAIPARRHRADAVALIQVLDAVDRGVLGQQQLAVRELLAPGSRTLTNVGEVASLDIEVRPHARRQARTVDAYVDARRSLATLTNQAGRRWAAVPVWNGDRISIVARGRVCPSRPAPCYGPDGAEPDRWRSYNYPAFASARHASLVAILPGQPLTIGRTASVVAKQSGLLLLFVNDTDVDNNDGGFEVQVTVSPAE
jgi:hypothetical protein